jgi:hypothetical protein
MEEKCSTIKLKVDSSVSESERVNKKLICTREVFDNKIREILVFGLKLKRMFVLFMKINITL